MVVTDVLHNSIGWRVPVGADREMQLLGKVGTVQIVKELVQLPTSRCPVCRYEMDAATCISQNRKAQPRRGDVSVCMKCGELLEFDEKLQAVPAALETVLALSQDKENFALVTRAQRLVRERRPVT